MEKQSIPFETGAPSIGFWRMCGLFLRQIRKHHFGKNKSLVYRTGLFCLLTNVPFGYLGLLVCGAMACVSASRKFWTVLGGVIYGISWGMLGLGVLIAGSNARHLRREVGQSWRACRKLRKGRQ